MIDIIILAIVQALTEFIPVSSSGHLLAIDELTSLESSLGIDVMLHIGTLLALVIYFWNRLVGILKDVLNGNWALATKLILTSIPAAAAGLLWQDVLEDARALGVVILMLTLVGLLMIFADQFAPKSDNTIKKLTNRQATLIGFGQALALVPGTSRSGITMLSGRFLGLSNKEAAEYAFLAGIPVIAGAGLKIFLEPETQDYISANTAETIVGIAVAASVGWLALRVLISYLGRKGLAVFGYYRLALAAILFIIWI